MKLNLDLGAKLTGIAGIVMLVLIYVTLYRAVDRRDHQFDDMLSRIDRLNDQADRILNTGLDDRFRGADAIREFGKMTEQVTRVETKLEAVQKQVGEYAKPK